MPRPAVMTASFGLAAATAVSLGLAASLGVFSPRRVHGPRRLSDDETSGVIVSILGFGIMGWASTNLVFALIVRSLGMPISHGKLSDKEQVLLSCAIFLTVFIILIIASVNLRKEGIKRLGIGWNRFPRGVAGGILGIIVILPLMFHVSDWNEIILKRLHQPVDEHYLLRILGSLPQTWLRWSIAFSAVILAPLAEELFFRGYLQTAVRYATNQPWLAIFCSALAWAAVHPSFEMLPIFFLGISLGYIYERSANLWTCIVVHALFNATSLGIFWHFLTTTH
ncbi:MAG: CPBP family intramembrane metalloprotease [Planctomycetota bacterium]|nr:CPBP family intramembrane metalloprotease [Planctomycetota bacterium]